MLLREDHVGQHVGIGVVDDDSALRRFRSGLRLKGCREGVGRRWLALPLQIEIVQPEQRREFLAG